MRGRIVFIDHHMMPTQDGSGYGQFGAPRRQGPTIASRKGAVAIVVRSIGTDHHRNPHTGVQTFGAGARPIPAAALTVPDAEQLQRILARGRPVRMHLMLTPRNTGTHQSGNVIADVPGTDPGAGMIVIGGHLDSWDLGTGAIDDGAGVAITAAAAHRIMQAGRPRRTIRIVLFGAEEPGGLGGASLYARHHPGDNVVLVGESDFGADRVWRVNSGFAPANAALADRIAALLAPLGIVRGREAADAGTDLGPWVRGRRRRGRPQPGRHPLFRLSPHAGRHARQGRSRPSCARMSPPGRRCSPPPPTRPSRSRGGRRGPRDEPGCAAG